MSKRIISMALVWALALAVIVGCDRKASEGDGASDPGDATTDAATTEETSDAFAGDARMMNYSKDGRALNHVISSSDDQTSVHITVAAD